MTYYIHLLLFAYASFISCLTTDTVQLKSNLTNHFSSTGFKHFNNNFLKSVNEYICSSTSSISDNSFTNSVNIKSDIGCQSISIIGCQFDSISIPDNSQSNGQISIIYIKNSNLSIENSNFQKCSSQSQISMPELDPFFCHAIYIDENSNHNVSIDNCKFLDNGNTDESSGTLIFSNKADNIEISFTKFESDTVFTRAFQSYSTSNIILSSNTFSKMTGPSGQNGGAILIQSSTDISISDCIFDSNTVRSKSTTTEKVCGSAFYINLNGNLIFTNNTISNHRTYLNSVIIFNKDDTVQNFERKIFISDSNFNNNEYTDSIDGSGIGFYSEDYSENFEKKNFLHIVFSGCQFKENGDSTKSDTASVLGWTRETTTFSFIDCQFESNKVSLSSSLIDIQNGFLLEFIDCTIEEPIKFCFLKFSPFLGENSPFDSEIQIKIANSSFINTDTTDKIGCNFILIEKETKLNASLIIESSTFSEISLNQNNCIIQCLSNLHLVQISNSSFSFTDKSTGSNLMKFQTSNIDSIILNDCIFERGLFALFSDVLINDLSFEDCMFIDCISDATIKCNSNHFSFNKCEINFSSNSVNECSTGIFVTDATTASFIDSKFKNCYGTQPGSAIRCLSEENPETNLIVNNCTFEECTPNSNVYTTNREVNFINNSITCSNTNKKINGIFINYMCRIFIDQCKFNKCSYSSDGASIRYFPTSYDKNVAESIIVQNSDFIECTGRAATISANPYFSLPKIINVSIINSLHEFNFIVETKAFEINKGSTFLLQNVSFIDNHPNGNVAFGGGGIGFWYKTTNIDEDTVSFINCNFLNTFYQAADSNNYGGGAICIQSRSCQNFHVKIENCTLKNCYSLGHNGGAIAITTGKTVQIENCYLEDCRIENSGNSKFVGGAIYVNQNSNTVNPFYLFNVTINESVSNTDFTAIDFECTNCNEFIIKDCNFINCKSRGVSASSYNIISCPNKVSKFECLNTNFIFDKKEETNPRAVLVNSPVFSFDNCTFIRCGSKRTNFGGAFYYDGKSTSETISIENCNFDECDATNSGAFKININSSEEPEMNNNTITNINSIYTISIEHKSSNMKLSVNIKNHKFIGNINNAADGGGSGIQVSNYINSDNNYGVILNINSCQFIKNFTPSNGGAFGIGNTEEVKLTELNIRYCNFTENNCNSSEGGGALWIRTSNDCTILYSNFYSNCASQMQSSHGGCIYLSFTSELLTLTIVECNFVNNSCPFDNSNGHAIYSALLYGSISISDCNFSDNGIGIEYKNSIIYTRSELSVYDSYFYFTNKEKSFARALYVGASSDLSLRGSKIVNCTAKGGNGAALYYTTIKNRLVGKVDIFDNIFINNTADEIGTELYMRIASSPMFYNCTFINENSTLEIVAVIYDELISYSTRFDRFRFIDCNFYYNQIYSSTVTEGTLESESISFYGCEFSNCSNISLNFKNVYSLELSNCLFNSNTNNDFFTFISNIQTTTIKNCAFTNNTLIPTNSNNFNHATILVSNSRLSIISTIFENQNNQDENDDSSNCFIIKTDSNLELTKVSFINSPKCKYAISFLPPTEIQYDEWQGISIYPSFSMDGCFLNNSGIVFIENVTQTISIINSYFSNFVDGLIYDINMSSNEIVSDIIQFENNTFDEFTNRACILTLFNDIELRNCTIKNCCCLNEDFCLPIFELNIRNNTINDFSLESLNFVNNSFNNFDTKRWMNGGGTGFIINFENLEEEKNENIFLNFIDCSFISNNAESFGGAFAFIETESTTFLNFDSCYFKDNSCKKLKGNALYLYVKNVSIMNCIFETSLQQKETIESSTVFLNFVPFSEKEEEKLISKTFSLLNCSFLNNQEYSFCLYNSTREIIVSNCLFSGNEDYSLFIDNCENDLVISETTFSNNQKNSLYVSNSNNFVSFLNCSFFNNQENALCVINCLKNVTVSECSFYDYNKKSISFINCQNDILIIDCLFESKLSERSNFDQNCCIFVETKTSILIQNTNFENNKNSFDFAITCKCRNFFTAENVSIENSGGISVLSDSLISDQIKLSSVTISNTNYGFLFEPTNEDLSVSISIIDCLFYSVKNALFLNLLNDKLVFQNNSFINCSNIDKNEEKSSIIEIKIGYSVNLKFDRINFINNQFLMPEKSKNGFGGGIGLKILNFGQNKRSFKVEFNQCDFVLNKATDGENNRCSGGGLYYVDDENDQLLLSSLLISDCTFTNNSAAGKGGAVYIETGPETTLSIAYCTFIINKAEIDAAALFVKNKCDFNLDSSQFINNSVSHTSSSLSMIPTDSLVINANANAVVRNVRFIKSSYANIETNVQALLSIDERNSDQISIQIIDSIFSSINPSKSIISLRNADQLSTIRIFNSSFTHFYLTTHVHSSLRRLKIINQSKDYIPIFIFDDLNGKIVIEHSCFDADSIYTFDKTKIGFDQDSSSGQVQVQGKISTDSSQVKSYECYYPPIIDELMKDIFDSTPSPSFKVKSKDNTKAIIIGSVVGSVVLIIIICVIIFVVIFIKRKKKREMEEKTKLETEKTNEMTEENELITNRLGFATQAMTQENPLFTYSNIIHNNINNNNDLLDNFYEESK